MVNLYTLFSEIVQSVIHLLPLPSHTFVTFQYLKIYPNYSNIYPKKLQKEYLSNNLFGLYPKKTIPFNISAYVCIMSILECQTTRLAIKSSYFYHLIPLMLHKIISTTVFSVPCCASPHLKHVPRFKLFLQPLPVSFFSSLALPRLNEPTRQNSHRIPQKIKVFFD